jgi:hypothetical protein
MSQHCRRVPARGFGELNASNRLLHSGGRQKNRTLLAARGVKLASAKPQKGSLWRSSYQRATALSKSAPVFAYSRN